MKIDQLKNYSSFFSFSAFVLDLVLVKVVLFNLLFNRVNCNLFLQKLGVISHLHFLFDCWNSSLRQSHLQQLLI